ncbi:MAG: tRNA lysidine(34) synthetase TilS [Bacteroidales bacterium]|jgi:tRNA(Ile)-lysidine synthase|nr:tRNA lysidine(34) synthetase TilS [Bacteroidales bacterium]
MQQEFQKYIYSNKLFSGKNRLLLGISGGIDSVCMFHLLRQMEIPIGFAHCNFQLRGNESDQDELFVKNLANQYSIPLFTNRFDTKNIAENKGISIQMAARNLRYDWFEEIREKYSYDYITIAHNRDDVIETFLINLTRGSGIKGFTGIKPKAGNIIRPLLYASRNEIINYINNNSFEYREDSSNKLVKYSRNLIRHEIIPLFEKINPSFRETLIENISKLKDVETVYDGSIENTRKSIFRSENQKILLSLEKLKALNPLTTFLYELLRPYGFSGTQVADIIESLKGISGKQFLSATYRLIKDRNDLIIEEISLVNDRNYYIDKDVENITSPISLNITTQRLDDNFKIIKSNKIGLFDLEKIEFPLILRNWKNGVYFMPLGMKSLKKLSDFFIDNKLSIIDKENVWILESSNKIVWIVGFRIDEKFKVTDKTNYVLKIEIF